MGEGWSDFLALIATVKGRGGYVKDLHGEKKMYYQVNATYFSALGESDERLLAAYPHAAWLNPLGESYWPHYQSVTMVKSLMADRMYPLTLAGLDAAMHELNH